MKHHLLSWLQVDTNSTLPVTISSITVLNAKNTRRSFLNRLFHPLLSNSDNSFYTLTEALQTLSKNVSKLERFDIYDSPISAYIDRPDASNPLSTPSDLDIFLSVREKSRFTASSGTWAGSNDGSVYFNTLFRNLFGGAESLFANVSYGTRERSAYSAGFETPILSNPDLRWEFGGLQSTTHKSWASHQEQLRGGFTKLKWISDGGHRHELGYTGMWRQNSGLAEKASPTVRTDAGDSFKSSLAHNWTLDRRDNPLLPTNGSLLKTTAEIAGLGPLAGDVAFGKLEAENQNIFPIPIPGLSTADTTGISFTTSLRGGVLYPLSLQGSSQPSQSRINDRFILGGPNDVRGFRFGGLGPHDGQDAVGSDVYAAGGASLLFPLPKVGKDKPLRLQAFINGGRLLALQDSAMGGDGGKGEAESSTAGFGLNDGAPSSSSSSSFGAGMSSQDVASSVRGTLAELGNGLPSVAAGIGLVYALPVARFELNFSLPLVMRRGEEARKGLSVGVGLTFL